MDRISLKAQERTILGKQVKKLRREGIIPAHVFGNKINTEHVSVKDIDFKKVYDSAGETGLVDLKIGETKVRPVLIREVQLDPLTDRPLHIDFYQVNLSEKVTVSVPLELIGDEPEVVHSGEAVVIQPISEVEVEALPTDLPEKIEVDISALKQIDDAILVSQLNIPQGVTILADPESLVVKLDNAVSAEAQQLMEEQAAETAAAQAEAVEEEGEAPIEGETEGEEAPTEGEEKPAEEENKQPEE